MSHPVPDRTESKREFDDRDHQQQQQQQPQPPHSQQSVYTTTPINPTTTATAIDSIHMIECTQRQHQLDLRLQSMYDEIKNERRDVDFEKRVAEFEADRINLEIKKRAFELQQKEAEFETKRKEAEFETKMREREAHLEEGEANLNSAKIQFQSIIEQHYLNKNDTFTLWLTVDGLNTVASNDTHQFGQGQESNQQPSFSPSSSLSNPGSVAGQHNQPQLLSQADIDSVRAELASKMDEITQKGKQMKRVVKELDNQRDDLVRKQFHFDNHVKSVEDEMKRQWDQIELSHGAVETQQDEIKAKIEAIQAKEDEIKTIKTNLTATSNTLAQILSQLGSEIFKHTEITALFGESITNPVAMAKLKAIVDFKLNKGRS